ncbi:MAG: nucleotidyltransferase family protein [Clostridia bacterium]
MNAVIMAGGKGTRLLPLTNDTPKPMMKIIDKPILEYIILLLKKHNITDIAITLGYMPESIMNYFDDGAKWGVKIKYFLEKEPLGTAGGVKKTIKFVDEDFIVISGDAFTEIDLSKAIKFHNAKNSFFTLIAQPKENPLGLGVLEIDENNKVEKFVEKPNTTKPALINTGIYIINKEVLKLIPEGAYDFGKQLIPKLIGEVFAYVDYNYWSDIGTLPSFYATNYKIAVEQYSQ